MNEELTAVPEQATGLSIFDSGAFQQMGVIASTLAASSLIPSSLKGKSDEETVANCFRVVEQAQRWGLSPFAVMDSASVVHGKLMWEGKLIAAAIKTSLGVRLSYIYDGEGDTRRVTVSGEVEGQIATIEGTVKDWKTTGNNSPWEKLANRDQMLAYRGARQWARRHAPEVILGVYSPDEFDEGELRNANPRKGALEVRDDYKEPEPKAEPTPKEEPTPTPTPKAKVQPLEGRQTVERLKIDCSVDSISEAKSTTNGATYRIITVKSGSHTTAMGLFGETIARELGELDREEIIEITYTKDSQGLMRIKGWKEIDPLDSTVEEGVA